MRNPRENKYMSNKGARRRKESGDISGTLHGKMPGKNAGTDTAKSKSDKEQRASASRGNGAVYKDRKKLAGGEQRTDRPADAKNRSRCPYSGKCGGCTWIDAPMEDQLRDKQSYVEECIGDYGPVHPIIRMKNPGRYRNKVTSVFGIDSHKKPVCGVYRERSHDIVPVKDCLIEDRTADQIIQTIFRLLPSFQLKVYDEKTGFGLIRAVQVRKAHATHEYMVTIVTNGPVFPSRNNFAKELVRLHPEITTIVQNINDRDTTMILGRRENVLYGKGYVEDELCGKRFRISSSSFYQVNSLQTEKLYRIAIDYAGLSGKEKVIDTYSGIGTIGICASDLCAQVIGVELNRDAAVMAKENAALNKADNVQITADDSGHFMADMASRGEHADVVFMDPPRSGASDEFLQSLLLLRPHKIVYISCNPQTMGDNLAVLTDGGYRLKKAVPVDMFPYTREVETVGLLLRQDS